MVLQFFSTRLFQHHCYIQNKSNPKLDLVGSPHVVNANTHVLCAISRPKANTVQWLTVQQGSRARKNYLLKRKSYLIIAQIYFCMLDGRPFCKKEKT